MARKLVSSGEMSKLETNFAILEEQFRTIPKRDAYNNQQLPLSTQHERTFFMPADNEADKLTLPLDFSTMDATATTSSLEHKEDNAKNKKLWFVPNNHSHELNAALGRLTVDVFEDEELQKLCDVCLNHELQRTKDGATEKTRIEELAGLVKRLRRCLREIDSRVGTYVEKCLKQEKAYLNQIEAAELTAERTMKSLEAERANVRKTIAQGEAIFKVEKADLGAENEKLKFDVNCLKRELDHVSDERNKLREEVKKLEQLRILVEAELKEHRKSSSQQLREVSANQGEAMRMLIGEKENAEKRELALREENLKLGYRLQATDDYWTATREELGALQLNYENLQSQFERMESEYLSLKERATQVQEQYNSSLTEHHSLNACLQENSRRIEELTTLLSTKSSEAAASAEKYESQKALYENALRTWLQEQSSLQSTTSQLSEQLTALTEERVSLKSALSAALIQKDAGHKFSESLQKTNTELSKKLADVRQQYEGLCAWQSDAEEKANSAQAALAIAQSELTEAKTREASKEARLLELEGQFEALKEVVGEGESREVVSALLTRISSLQAAMTAAEAERRRLHDQLVDIKGNIRVYCRVRPHPLPSVRCLPDNASVQISVSGKEHAFTYDRVFGPSSSQEEVFASVSELVQSALDGHHVCLFSYGQTGAGKTHTMQGGNNPKGRGITPRAVEKILEAAAHMSSQEWEYTMEASCLEIYNNNLRDLLAANKGAAMITDQNAIKHDAAGGHTMVAGVNRIPVRSMQDAADLLERANASRACEATAMNHASSRSHCVFMLYISGAHPPSGTLLTGCLCLVDLAGSERLDRSLVEDQRKKEACAINQSLSSLGDIFAALANKSPHVPYRNSKLTYLLQPCLGGSGKTLMFVNINPDADSAQESLCSLKFASKVNSCETAAKGGAKRSVTQGSTFDEAAAKRMSMPGVPTTSRPLAQNQEDTRRLTLSGIPRPLPKQQANSASAVTGVKRVTNATSIPAPSAKRYRP